MRLWAALYRSPVVRWHMKGPLNRSAQEWWSGLMQLSDQPTQPLCVVFTSTDEFVGVCGFLKATTETDEWEIYCQFRRKHWRHGYATEVCRALLRAAFDQLHAGRVIGIINPGNTASISLVEQLGFRREGIHTNPGNWQDGHLFFAFDGSAYNFQRNVPGAN